MRKIFTLVFLCSTALLLSACTTNVSRETTQVQSPMATQSGSEKSTTALPVLNASELVPDEVCSQKLASWKSTTIANTVSIKIPSYFNQKHKDSEENIEINHPTLGKLLLTSAVVGDYMPIGIVGFENQLHELITTNATLFGPTQRYQEKNSIVIVTTDTPERIIARSANPLKWWMFSIVSQDTSTGDSQTKVQEFLQSDDFKCVMRSTYFY